jgi:hypothetical protein
MNEEPSSTVDSKEESAAAKESADQVDSPNIGREVELFVNGIDSLRSCLGPVMFSLQSSERGAAARFRDFAESHGTLMEQDTDVASYSFETPYGAQANRLSSKASRAEVAVGLVPRIFVMALAGQFDAFLGCLLRALFLMRPELMASSERSLTLAQLLELGSVEAATNLILDKEVETVLRKSRTEQFDWMENKFGIKLRAGLESWPTLIEVTERRNLFAHTSGMVSDQYLAVCRSNNVALDEGCAKGSELTVTPEYFRRAAACHFEIGVKLSQVLWRKLRPDQLEAAGTSIIRVTYELIVDHRHELARELLDFATRPPMKHDSEQTRLMLTVNRAQACKWAGDAVACKNIISQEDWSACDVQFRLAVAVLNDAFEDAEAIMRSIGPKGKVTQADYQEWPLFREFRQSQQFVAAYADVFSEPFVHIEKSLREEEDQRRKEALQRLKEYVDREAQADESGDEPASPSGTEVSLN